MMLKPVEECTATGIKNDDMNSVNSILLHRITHMFDLSKELIIFSIYRDIILPDAESKTGVVRLRIV